MTFFLRFASPLVLFSLAFLWVVLFHDLSWTAYVLGCGATAGGMMALIASSHLHQRAGVRRRVVLLGAACVGVAVALIWGLALPPVTVGTVALLVLHVPGFAGMWFLLRPGHLRSGAFEEDETKGRDSSDSAAVL